MPVSDEIVDTRDATLTEPTIEDIEGILEQFHHSDWDELRVHSDNFDLHVFKTPGKQRSASTAPLAPSLPSQPETINSASPSAASQPTTAGPSSTEKWDDDESGLIIVRAPNLGTFYRAPKPGAPPFVAIGEQVEPATELCIIEVMKLFTAVQAGTSGIIREILVEDAELVEYNQPLFVIEPPAP